MTVMIGTFVSSIIYSKEFANWIINWPTETAFPIFFLSIERDLTPM